MAPGYAFGQILSFLNTPGNDNLAAKTNGFIATIYLSRGVHHYITCQEHDKVELTEENLCDKKAIFVCMNTESAVFGPLFAKGCPGMTKEET